MAGSKDNMKQAMKELLGLVGIGPEGDKDSVVAPPEEPEFTVIETKQQEAEKTMEKDVFGGSQPDEKRFAGGFTRRRDGQYEEPLQFDAAMDEAPAAPAFTPDPNLTVLSVGASIFGDIRSEGTVEVQGKLKGNLEATGNIRISGKVLGDVKGDAVTLVGCAVQGNITATSMLRIDQGTVVVGDINAQDLDTDGKVKGNVQVERTASFRKNAVLSGNVAAGLVSMTEGAKIQGTVRISEDSETNALFGDDLDI